MRNVATILLLLAATWVSAQDIKTCRGMADSTQRLACYDSLTLNGVSTPTQPGREQAVADFGLEVQRLRTAIEDIVTRINGRFEGWEANDVITFDNGQRWKIADDSKAYLDLMSPSVKIRRGAMGAFYLELDGTNHSPRIVRLK